MPGENGLECLVSIRDFPAYKSVPLIIYTTSTLCRDVTEAFKNGASLYLPKTSSEAELIKMVQYVITEREKLQFPQKDNFCVFALKKMI